jgi:hypothetical protein
MFSPFYKWLIGSSLKIRPASTGASVDRRGL